MHLVKRKAVNKEEMGWRCQGRVVGKKWLCEKGHFLKVAAQTAVDWYNFIRDICAQYFIDQPSIIGGPGVEDIPLPEISVEEFHQAWTRFELAAVAKEWNAAKQLSVVPALLRGKLLDYYVQLEDSEKSSMKALIVTLMTRSGIAKEPLSAAKLFTDRVQA
ncbi:hypothetical protein EMCRGX_G003762 [Ephydatia muelleri]